MVARIANLALFVLIVALPVCAQSGAGTDQEPAGQAGVTLEQALDHAQDMLDAGSQDAEFLKEAVKLTEAVLERDPENINAKLLNGELQLLLGEVSPRDANFDLARRHFKSVIDSEPSNFRANLGYGKVLLANRAWRQASFFLETAEGVAPQKKRAEAKQLLATVYTRLGQSAKAIEKAEEAAQVDPDDLDALQTLVNIRISIAGNDPRHMEGAMAAAETYVKKSARAVEEAPWERARLERLATAYQLQVAMLSTYHNALYVRDVHNVPTDQLRPGKESDATSVLLLMAEKMRLQAAVRSALIDHDAVMLAERAVEYQPNSVRCLEALATACRRIQDREKAVEAWRRILSVEPNHAEARRQLTALGAASATPPEAAAAPD